MVSFIVNLVIKILSHFILFCS